MIIERINTDLANVLGNLVNRSLSMVNKYFGGDLSNKAREWHDGWEPKSLPVSNLSKAVSNKMEDFHVADAISEIMEVLRRSNKYIDETLPWNLAKDEANRDRLETVLYNLLESIRIAAINLRSFIPETSDNILNQLNTQQRSYESSFTFGLLEDNLEITKTPTALPSFQRRGNPGATSWSYNQARSQTRNHDWGFQ